MISTTPHGVLWRLLDFPRRSLVGAALGRLQSLRSDHHPSVSGGAKPRINGEQRASEATRCRAGHQEVASRQAASRLLPRQISSCVDAAGVWLVISSRCGRVMGEGKIRGLRALAGVAMRGLRGLFGVWGASGRGRLRRGAGAGGGSAHRERSWTQRLARGCVLAVILRKSRTRRTFRLSRRRVSATGSPRALMSWMAKRRRRVVLCGP